MKEKGQKDMEFIKLKDIPNSEPRYQKTMFEALFKNRKKVKASSLQYKFADTVQVVKDDIKYDYQKYLCNILRKLQGSYPLYCCSFQSVYLHLL